jgi:pyruvate/2-oxoglutarate dehydrogenase complex dihydrolipoamide dehydrogenase (E3) component
LETVSTDICVLGAGSAGLSVAAGAAQMGASCVLVEKGEMGGECLNTGCVPSKALLAAAEAAQSARDSGHLGVSTGPPRIAFRQVRDHVRGVIAAIAPNDSVARFEGLGVRVVKSRARFVGRREVAAGETLIRARRFVVATGSTPLVPPIPGLGDVDYFTNETIFDVDECPGHLIVIGGGPIGLEIAQAYRRLGARVTVVEMLRCLANDDPEISRVALDKLTAEGVTIAEHTKVVRIEAVAAGGLVVLGQRDGAVHRFEGSHLLVAIGRKANTAGLDLESAGIAYGGQGIEVDAGLRTTNRRVFAIGDVVGPFRFTHMAAYQAGIVIRRALFRLPAKVDYRAVPWVTYTDPEVAQVGLTEAQARRGGRDIRVLRWPFADNDRAQAERRTDGLVKAVVSRRGQVLGASLVGVHAGELLLPWVLMVSQRLKIGAMASVIAPYPTLGEASKRAAGSFYTPSLFSAGTRRMVRFLSKLG